MVSANQAFTQNDGLCLHLNGLQKVVKLRVHASQTLDTLRDLVVHGSEDLHGQLDSLVEILKSSFKVSLLDTE